MITCYASELKCVLRRSVSWKKTSQRILMRRYFMYITNGVNGKYMTIPFPQRLLIISLFEELFKERAIRAVAGIRESASV